MAVLGGVDAVTDDRRKLTSLPVQPIVAPQHQVLQLAVLQLFLRQQRLSPRQLSSLKVTTPRGAVSFIFFCLFRDQ